MCDGPNAFGQGVFNFYLEAGDCNTIKLTVLIDSLQNNLMMSRLLIGKTWYMSLSAERKTYLLFTAECMRTSVPPFIAS